MDKITYLAELAEGLARWVPERERQDILRYYAEYFDEAGPGKEAEVVRELGDPWALASRLAVEGGYVSQETANAWTPRQGRRKVWPVVVAAAVACVAIMAVSVGSLVFQVVRGIARNSTVIDAAVVEAVEFGDAIRPGSGPVTYYSEGAEVTGGVWSMEDGWLEPFYVIDADISMGNITITDGEDYTLAIQQDSNLGGYSLKWELQGDTLKIRDGSTGSSHVGLDGLGDLIGRKGLDVIITVPEGEYLQKVTAKTEFGNVFLYGLDVEVKVTAKTQAGNVEGYELRTAEKVELKTDMGNVTFGMGELCDGMEIELKTNLGDVEANMACDEQDCRYELETELGQVTINGADHGSKAERKGSYSCKLDAESDLGNVDVFFYDSRWE